MTTIEFNKQELYLDNVLTIKQFFNRHRSGGYIFAVTRSFALKKEVNHEVIEYCSEQNLQIGEADIKLNTDEGIFQQLQKARDEFPHGLILNNIDELMLQTQSEFVYRLNQMREALFSLHIPILIWLTPENHGSFTHKAIDLYTRRDLDTVFFQELTSEDINHLMERSEMRLGQKEDPETLRTRIALLEKQLDAARKDAEVPRNRVAKEIVLPLIKAYKELLLLSKAKELLREFENDFDKKERDAFIEFGELCYYSGNLDSAIDFFEKALKFDIETLGEESPNVAMDYNELALVFKNKGDSDKAILYLEKALAIHLKFYGEENPDVATIYNNLGAVWQDKGVLNKTISYLEKALAIDLKLYGDETLKASTRYNNLGLAWKDKGNFEKSITYLEKALTINLKLFGEKNPFTATSYNNLGLVWKRKRRLDKAIDCYEKALAIDLKLFNEGNPHLAIRYNNLATVWHDKGDLNKAKEYYEKSLQICTKLYGTDNPTTKTVQENLNKLAY